MSTPLDYLAKQRARETEAATDSLDKNIRQGMAAGMSVEDVMSNFNFPKEVNPYQATASVFLGKHYGVSPGEAYNMYGPLKNVLYPNITDEELVEKFYNSQGGLPETTVTQETHKEKAEKMLKDFPIYKAKRQAEIAGMDLPMKGLFQSKESYDKQSIPMAKEALRKRFNDDYFGKGTQRDMVTQEYYDALFTAIGDPEKQREHTQTYTKNLAIEQEHRLLEIERLEYQIENNTASEGFWARKKLAKKRAGWRWEMTMANLGVYLAKGLEKLPGLDRENIRAYGTGWPLVYHYQEVLRAASFHKDAPELWRPELNALDGMTNALIENVPTMGLGAAMATIGAPFGGAGISMGIFLAAGAGESAPIYTDLINKGYSYEEANKRTAQAFVMLGIPEAMFGGITKFKPTFGAGKKFLQNLKKFGLNYIKEMAEEIPQELGGMMLGDATPYNPDGTIDKEAFANQMILLARDTAFISGFMSSTSQGMSSVSAHQFKVEHGISKDEAVMAAKNMEEVLAEAKTREKDIEEKLVSGEMKPGEEVYTDDAYLMAALAKQIPIEGKYTLTRNEDMAWEINGPDIKEGIAVASYKEGLIKYQTMAPFKNIRHSVYPTLEQIAPEEYSALIAKSAMPTEPLSNVPLATKYALKANEDGTYEVWDVDTNQQIGKGMSEQEALKLKLENNIGTGSQDPLVTLRRFVQSRAMNGVLNNIYDPIAGLLDTHASLESRMVQAQAVKKYLTDLRNGLLAEYDKTEADRAVPEDFIEQVNQLPGQVGDLTSDHRAMNNLLLEIIRKGQLYGEGLEADMRRNWVRGWINKIKPFKHHKDVTSEKAAKRGVLERSWDTIAGTSVADHITTALSMFGTSHVPLSMKIIKARQRASSYWGTLINEVIQIQEDLEITSEDRKEWSELFSIQGRKALEYPVIINGQTRKLTMAQIMWLNLAFRDPSLMQQFRTAGVTTANLEFGSMSDEEMAGITAVLAQDRKALALVDRFRDLYIHDRGDIMNVAGMDILGHELVSEESYLPVKRMEDKGAILIPDIFKRLVEDIRTASHYAGIEPTMHQLQALMHNKELRMALQKHGKGKHLRRFQDQMKAMDRSKNRDSTLFEKALTRLGANRARSILANGRIATLQVGSMQLYQYETDSKYMFGHRAPQEVYDTWVFLNQRKAGMGSVHSEVSEGTVKKAITGKGPILDNTLYVMHKADLLVITQAASIAWREMTAEVLTGKARRYWDAIGYSNPRKSFEKMSPEFMVALHDRADYLVTATQPMFFPESRNQYSASDKPFLKEMARFRAFTDQLYRAQTKQIALWRMGEISGREMALSVGRGMIFASVWYNGLRWLYDSMFGDEDKERDVFLEMVVGPLSLIPFIGWPLKSGVVQLISETSGYGPADFTSITFDQVNHTKNTMYTLARAIFEEDDAKAEKYWEDGMREAAKDVLIIFFGLPDYPVDWFFEDEAETSGTQYTIY